MKEILHYMNTVFTACFTFECFLKLFACGFAVGIKSKHHLSPFEAEHLALGICDVVKRSSTPHFSITALHCFSLTS